MARRRELTTDFHARKLIEARAYLQTMTPVPRPQPSLQVYSANRVSSTRRVGCVRYGACLNLAFASRWEGFSCESCDAFTLPSREDFMADMEGLTLLLAAVIKRQPAFLEEAESVQMWP
jgi:hypothetical protein